MKISREFLIGVVVISSIAVLYLGVSYLKGINLFASRQTFYALYENAAGLTPSNAVILNGFKIGIVKDVHMNENGDGTIVAEVVINDTRLRVPEDTRLEIFDADLFGGKAIQLVLGTSPTLAQDEDTLASSISLGLTESIKQEIEPLKKKTSQLFSSVDSVLNNLNNVLSNSGTEELGDIFASLKNTMQTLENTAGKLNTLIDDNSDKMGEIFTNVRDISANIRDNNEAITNAINNIQSMSDTLAKLNLTGTLKRVDSALEDFNLLLTDITQGDGSLAKLISTDTLHTELVNASHSLDLLLDDMRKHPKRYLNFSLVDRSSENEEFSKAEIEQLRKEIATPVEKK